MEKFMFSTGIECSYPTIQHGRHRVDELETTGHYTRWQEDLQLTHDMGITHLRYGVPYHTANPARGVYDWAFMDEALTEMRRLNIEPMIDLCHFGMPDWLGNSFQNPEFAEAFADYAEVFAARYPWVKFYTPVNEIFVCGKFSGLYGWWNEQESSDASFVTSVKHMAKASLLSMKRILQIQPNAVFLQSESTEFTHTMSPSVDIQHRAWLENQIRFLGLDLLYGHPVDDNLLPWLLENGVSMDEYMWFMNQSPRTHSRGIIGTDYYITNERMIDEDGSVQNVGDCLGWYVLSMQYYNRYRKPLMYTETNIREEANAIGWLWKQWQNILRMREDGVPVMGFTWYSLTDQVDWDTALREPNLNVNPLGLYDLNRQIRPVGKAYRSLIERFNWLPNNLHSDLLDAVVALPLDMVLSA
jgi:beta-glucosidase/6-phospho-beta-glucosidase/beta-galactosidase